MNQKPGEIRHVALWLWHW